MEGYALSGINGGAKLQDTTAYIYKLVDMLMDRDVSMSEIFEFIASKCPGKTPEEVEYEIRDQIASTYIGLINYVDDVFSKIGTKLEKENEGKENEH